MPPGRVPSQIQQCHLSFIVRHIISKQPGVAVRRADDLCSVFHVLRIQRVLWQSSHGVIILKKVMLRELFALDFCCVHCLVSCDGQGCGNGTTVGNSSELSVTLTFSFVWRSLIFCVKLCNWMHYIPHRVYQLLFSIFSLTPDFFATSTRQSLPNFPQKETSHLQQ